MINLFSFISMMVISFSSYSYHKDEGGAEFLGVTAHVSDFNYLEGHGEGIIENVELFFSSRNQSKSSTPHRVQVDRNGNHFQIKLDFFTLDWKKVPNWISNIEELNVHEIDGHLGTDKNHFITIDSFDVRSSDEWLKGTLKNFDFFCVNQVDVLPFEKKLLQDCLKLGSLKVGLVDYPEQIKFFEPIVKEIEEETDEDISRIMEDLTLEFIEGNFELKLKTKILFKSRIKVLGNAEVDLDKKVVQIRLDQVKIGLLPVTPLVWREIKKRINSPQITIDQPYIKYTWQ